MRVDTWSFKVDKIIPYHLQSRQLNVIESFTWTINATDGEKSGSVSGSIAFDTNNIDTNNFMTIQDIDEDVLKQWVLSTLSESRINSIMSNLDHQLNNQQTIDV